MLVDIVGVFLALVCVVYIYKHLMNFLLKVMSTRPDVGSKVPRRLAVKYAVVVDTIKTNIALGGKTILVYDRSLGGEENIIIADSLVKEIKAGKFGACSYQRNGGWLWVSSDPEELEVKHVGESKCVA